MAKMVAIYSNELLFKHSNTIIREHKHHGIRSRPMEVPKQEGTARLNLGAKVDIVNKPGIKLNLCSFESFVSRYATL